MKKEKETQKGKGEYMKAFLILEDGTVFTGTSIGSTKDMISDIRDLVAILKKVK